MAKLYIERGWRRGTELRLEDGKSYTIGRSSACALTFRDGLVSREHFRVRARQGRYHLDDLESYNGTFVNGEPVNGTCELAIGDQIEIGDTLVSLLADNEYRTEGGLVGHTIGGYCIVERIGRGGMGTVYRAQQLSLGRDVAFKVLSPALARDREFLERFDTEVRAAARLSHPNIAQAFGVGVHDAVYYFTMEFVPGGGIDERIERETRIAPEDAVPMLVDTAHGLAYAEEQGVIHRDIKPENLMLDERGAVKIVDLGIACIVIGRRRHAQAEGVFGSAHYIAPEQAAGRRIDHRVDMYGLGASAYHMLSGRTLFTGKSEDDLMRKHMAEAPEPLERVAPWVPAGLCQVVSRMVAKKPEERYQSAKELVAELERLNIGAATRRPTEVLRIIDLVERPKTTRRAGEQRRKRLLIAGLVCGLVFLGVVVLLAILLTRW